MKQLFLFLSFMCALACSAQERPQPIGSPKTALQVLGPLYADSLFKLPTVKPLSNKWKIGSIIYQISDSSVYLWTGWQWLKQSTGGGGGSNLTLNSTSNSVQIANDNGSGVTLPVVGNADGTAGIVTDLQKNVWDSKLSGVNLTVDQTVNKTDISTGVGATGSILPVTNSRTGVMTPAMLADLNSKLGLVSTTNSVTGTGLPSAPIKLVGDVTNPGVNKVYGTDGTGTRVWKDDPSGGSGTQTVIPITLAQLDAGVGLDTNFVYFVTDEGKQGRFSYSGLVANQTTDNGATVIVSADNRQWKRIYFGPLQFEWFGGKQGSISYAASNNAAYAKMNSTAKDWEEMYIGAGKWYFDTSIWVRGTITKHDNLYTVGELIFENPAGGDGVSFWGEHPYRFVNESRIKGPGGAGTRDSMYYENLPFGRGVVFRSAQKGLVRVNQIEFFKVGAEFAGYNHPTGVQGGCQYNKFYFNQLRYNQYQLRFWAYENPSNTSGNNWVNENQIFGGQLGHNNYGAGGWWGFATGWDAASGAVGTGGFEGNELHLRFEGLEYAMDAKILNNTKFFGATIEQSVRHYFKLGPYVTGVQFLNCRNFQSQWLRHPNMGSRTYIQGEIMVVDTTNESNQGPVNAFEAMVINRDGRQRLQILAGDYTTGTAWHGGYTNYTDMVSPTGRYPTTQAGATRLDGVVRFTPYKQTYINITNQTADTIELPYNVGYIRYAHTSDKVLRIRAADLVGNDFETIKIEYVGPGKPTFVRGDNNTVAVASSVFSTTGAKHRIDYRSAGFVNYRVDGSGASASLIPQAVGSAPNNNGFTYDSGTGNFTLQPADSTNPGVVKPGDQNLGVAKRLDSMFTRKLIFQDFGKGFGPLTVFRTQNGLSFNGVSTANSSSTTLTAYEFGSGSNTKDIVFTLGKTGTNAVHFGGNSIDFFITPEKSNGGVEFRNNISYNSYSLTGGNLLGKIFGSGNWLIQRNGVAVDAGYRLDVQGTMRVTGIPTFSALSGASTQMAVINPDGTMGVQTIPSGGGGGSSIFTLGPGSRNAYYRTLGSVNIGANPAQSYAWTHWGASTSTLALWELDANSVYPSVPRNNSISYNKEDLQLTNNLGFSYKILKENTVADVTGLSWKAYDIDPEYLDPVGSKKGDVLTSNGSDGYEPQRPRYVLAYSNLSSSTVSSTSATSLIGGQKTFTDEALKAGDIVELRGSGSISTSSSRMLTWVVEMAGATVSDVINFTSGSNFKYCIRIQIKTSTTAEVEFELETGSFGHRENYGPITINTDDFTLNFTGAWNLTGASIVTKFNTGEIKRLPEP